MSKLVSKVGEAKTRVEDAGGGVGKGLSRRALLQASGAVLGSSFATACGKDDPGHDGETGNDGCTPDYEGKKGPAALFAHGVASGDPLPDAVILWTRVSVDGEKDVDVAWELSHDAEFGKCTASGSATASA